MSEKMRQLLGANIRARLAAEGISQAELAKRIKSYPANVSGILNGHTGPAFDTLCLIASALGVEPSELLASAKRPRKAP